MTFTKTFAKPLIAAAMMGVLGTSGVAMAQKAPANAAANAQNQIAQLKNVLKINAGQESVWNGFVTAYTQNFNPSRNPSAAQFNAMKTPQRIEFLKNLRAEENAFLTKSYDASLALCNELDDGQKQMFDEMTSQPVQQAPRAAAKKK